MAASTRAGAGIQSLTVALSVCLTVCTGVLIGVLAITTWEDLLRQARATGDEGVTTCLASGERDIRYVSGRYLRSVLDTVSTDANGFFEVPLRSLEDLGQLMRATHPVRSLSAEFLNGPYRNFARAKIEVLKSLGAAQIDMIPVLQNRTHRAAGELIFLTADFSMGVMPSDGTVPVMSVEMRDPHTGGFAFNPNFSYIAEVNATGEWKHPDQLCSYHVNWALGERGGPCVVPTTHLVTDVRVAQQGRLLDNIVTADGPLLEPGVVHVSPLMPVFSMLKTQLSLVVAHPDMQSFFPRQEGRVMSMMVSVDAAVLTSVFLRQDLPKGSLLYGVQHDHWTGEAGHLIGFNKGRFMDYYNKTYPGMGVFPQALPLNVTMHTMEAGSQVPSTIAWHGRHVFATHQHNYAGLHAAAQAGGETFQAWVSQEGTEYWAVVSQVTRGGLRLYLNLLVPRESVMDAIDASTSAIREKNEADKRRADDQQGQALIVMFSVTAAAVSVLLVLAVVLSRLIVSPLHSLQADMANVAIMNLEAVDLERDPSRLSEVSVMQQSFRLMVRNLMEYRNYMPQSVLVGDSTSGTDTGDQDMHSISGNSSVSNTSSAMGQCGPAFAADAVRRRSISLIYFNVVGWHNIVDSADDRTIITTHAQILSALLRALQGPKGVRSAKGVCDIVSGDRLMGTFNAFAPLNSHKRHCLTAALAGKQAVEALGGGIAVSAAAASGEARVAHMGCQGLKKVTITSAVVPWVVALERYNRAKGLRITAGQSYRELMPYFVMKAVDAVQFDKLSKKPIGVYEVIQEVCHQSSCQSEWMYEMQDLESRDPYHSWNVAVRAVWSEQYAAAAAAFKEVNCNIDALYRPVGRACAHPHLWLSEVISSQCYRPVCQLPLS